jgi:hypothetical protein
MSDPPDHNSGTESQSHYEVWLAERELLSAATLVRDAAPEEVNARTRAGYEAAWMRFMVALCNLPFGDRPGQVERVIDALRVAHLLRSRGDLLSSPPPLSLPPASPDADESLVNPVISHGRRRSSDA